MELDYKVFFTPGNIVSAFLFCLFQPFACPAVGFPVCPCLPAESRYKLQTAVGAGVVKEESSILRNSKESETHTYYLLYLYC